MVGYGVTFSAAVACYGTVPVFFQFLPFTWSSLFFFGGGGGGGGEEVSLEAACYGTVLVIFSRPRTVHGSLPSVHPSSWPPSLSVGVAAVAALHLETLPSTPPTHDWVWWAPHRASAHVIWNHAQAAAAAVAVVVVVVVAELWWGLQRRVALMTVGRPKLCAESWAYWRSLQPYSSVPEINAS